MTKKNFPFRHDYIWIAYFLTLAILLLLLVSCKRVEYVTVDKVVEKTDTFKQVKIQRDSIHVKDSVFLTEYVKGDTIFRIKEKWYAEYIDRWHTDTIYKSKTDSVVVPQPYPVEVKVPREKKWWESALEWIGLITLFGCGIWIASKLKK